MKKILIILFMFFCAGYSYGKEKNKVISLCAAGDVKKIEVIYYPGYISTNVAMNADQLTLRYIYRFEINNVQDVPVRDEIMKMLDVDYEKHNNTNDIRWGVGVTSTTDKKCNIYFDVFGHCGEINGIKVCFKKNTILEWIKNNIPLFVKYDQ